MVVCVTPLGNIKLKLYIQGKIKKDNLIIFKEPLSAANLRIDIIIVVLSVLHWITHDKILKRMQCEHGCWIYNCNYSSGKPKADFRTVNNTCYTGQFSDKITRKCIMNLALQL